MPTKKVKEPDEETPGEEPEQEEPVEGQPDDGSSPEDEDFTELDLDSLVEEKVKAAVAKVGGDKGEAASPPEAPPAPEGDGGSEGSAPPPAPSPDVESAVRKVLDDRDHAEKHRALENPPPKERPPRKGLARAVWGP